MACPASNTANTYLVRFRDDPEPARILQYYSTNPSASPGSWCLQTHCNRPLHRVVLRDANTSNDPTQVPLHFVIHLTHPGLIRYVFRSFAMHARRGER